MHDKIRDAVRAILDAADIKPEDCYSITIDPGEIIFTVDSPEGKRQERLVIGYLE